MGLLRLTPTFSPLWTSLWAQLPLLVTGPSRQQDQPSLQRESESEKGRETGDGDANGPGPDDEHRTEAPPPWGGSAGALPTPALHPAPCLAQALTCPLREGADGASNLCSLRPCRRDLARSPDPASSPDLARSPPWA